ncbi:MAG: hypothetical protein C0P68_008325 [Bacillota bacterium]
MKSVFLSEKWLLLVSILLLLKALLGIYAVLQKNEQLQEARVKTAQAQAELERMKARLAQPVSPPDVEAMSRAVPSDWQLPYVLADVTLSLQRHGLQLQSLSVGEPVQGDASVEKEEEAAETTEELAVDPSEGMEPSAESSRGERFGPQPPAALAGIRTLPLVLDVTGPIGGGLAFLDDLHQWPRLVWLTGLELAAEASDEPPDWRVYMNVYAGALWEGTEEDTWPFSIPSANNGQAFGAH